MDSDSVGVGQRVLENADLEGGEGEHKKEQGKDTKDGNRPFLRSARKLIFVKESRFIQVRDCCGNKKDGDVQPIGRPSDPSVIGVEDHGDQDDPSKDPSQLYTPKIFPIPKEKALYRGKKQHWPKQKLHMLPG